MDHFISFLGYAAVFLLGVVATVMTSPMIDNMLFNRQLRMGLAPMEEVLPKVKKTRKPRAKKLVAVPNGEVVGMEVLHSGAETANIVHPDTTYDYGKAEMLPKSNGQAFNND